MKKITFIALISLFSMNALAHSTYPITRSSIDSGVRGQEHRVGSTGYVGFEAVSDPEPIVLQEISISLVNRCESVNNFDLARTHPFNTEKVACIIDLKWLLLPAGGKVTGLFVRDGYDQAILDKDRYLLGVPKRKFEKILALYQGRKLTKREK